MTLAVEVQDASAGPVPDPDELTAWAQAAWRDPDVDAEIVIRLCDEDEGRQLNLEYRGKDRPTNVLSFPYEAVPGLDMHHVGDLVICAPVVVREAAEQDKALHAHWAHMVVHGTLHLQGYDHETDPQAEQMEGLETEILSGLGFPAPYADDERL